MMITNNHPSILVGLAAAAAASSIDHDSPADFESAPPASASLAELVLINDQALAPVDRAQRVPFRCRRAAITGEDEPV